MTYWTFLIQLTQTIQIRTVRCNLIWREIKIQECQFLSSTGLLSLFLLAKRSNKWVQKPGGFKDLIEWISFTVIIRSIENLRI